ncbi:unnamed protein product [Ranitomeya imitator]|uniref:Ion transport domain-containing protein n=1 Tax=Ranitomeya imitator TaxID=111125 RepID=A0ABN9M7B3_9NEOB|nr:unnamed protein product [Ranitomeya imitator]
MDNDDSRICGRLCPSLIGRGNLYDIIVAMATIMTSTLILCPSLNQKCGIYTSFMTSSSLCPSLIGASQSPVHDTGKDASYRAPILEHSDTPSSGTSKLLSKRSAQLFLSQSLEQKRKFPATYPLQRQTLNRHISSLFETLQSLFWSVFGLLNLYVTNVKARHEFTEFVGATMFGTYNVISLVVLLNMLIAMMNNSYQLIATERTKWPPYRFGRWWHLLSPYTTSPWPSWSGLSDPVEQHCLHYYTLE